MDSSAVVGPRWVTRRVILVVCGTIVAIATVVGILNVALGDSPFTVIGNPVLPDYLAHWIGGRLVVEGDASSLFDRDAQYAVQSSVIGPSSSLAWYVSPPFAAVVYAPFALLPYVPSALLWAAITIGLLLASLWLMRPLFPRLGGRDWIVVGVAIAATQPLLQVIGSGQDTALSLFLWVAALRLLRSGRDVGAGALLALGLMKPQLFVLAPVVLLAQRRWRALGAWAATASAMALVSVAVVGVDGVLEWIGLPFSDLYRSAVQTEQAWRMQGLPSLLVAIAPPGGATIAHDLGLLLAAGIVVLFLATAFRAAPPAYDGVWAFALLTTVVASPHLLEYDLVFAVPAILYVLDRHDSTLVRWSVLALVLLTWSGFPRHDLLIGLPWPITVLGVAWGSVALAVLWVVLWRDLERRRVAGGVTAAAAAPVVA
ncbi:MAG: glycosyltransferase family 87 protein [Candidatus Nanopelagicales bacterium]